MFEPLVSIVIPVYNGADYLREAIDSALSQTYRHTEVIVVDDGSSDDGASERVALEYGEKIRYIKKANGGVATALNVGLQQMRGKYFAWLSHDDVFVPEKIERQVQALKVAGHDAVVCSGYELIDSNSKVLPNSTSEPVNDDPVLAILATSLNGCTLLVPRECFRVAGLFNPALPTTQDNEMWLRIALAGFRFVTTPEVLLKSRQHPQQGSRTMTGHSEERTRWYMWAVDALRPEDISDAAPAIAETLLRKCQPGAFLHFLRRQQLAGRRKLAARLLWSLFPLFLLQEGKKLLRSTRRAVWVKPSLRLHSR
jgi:glycosyltransferase involved in cell wall biosynthesis